MNGIGPRLREERERLGMTQRVFGDIGGVEPNAQGKYESGERTPRVDYLAALAARGWTHCTCLAASARQHRWKA
ncbi:hypothetical protein GLGCALEP_04503 [Pseudomonas sp. MM221]|nr:hypothetical protein GLGCALEP_04503 [Pseudomonas sp. MM221]